MLPAPAADHALFLPVTALTAHLIHRLTKGKPLPLQGDARINPYGAYLFLLMSRPSTYYFDRNPCEGEGNLSKNLPLQVSAKQLALLGGKEGLSEANARRFCLFVETDFRSRLFDQVQTRLDMGMSLKTAMVAALNRFGVHEDLYSLDVALRRWGKHRARAVA